MQKRLFFLLGFWIVTGCSPEDGSKPDSIRFLKSEIGVYSGKENSPMEFSEIGLKIRIRNSTEKALCLDERFVNPRELNAFALFNLYNEKGEKIEITTPLAEYDYPWRQYTILPPGESFEGIIGLDNDFDYSAKKTTYHFNYKFFVPFCENFEKGYVETFSPIIIEIIQEQGKALDEVINSSGVVFESKRIEFTYSPSKN